jgi:hypothetical protein
MLAGIFVIGLIVGLVCRYFMTRKMPWMIREGTVLVFIYSIGRDGVEMSLPKMVGAVMTFFLIYLLLVRFIYPRVIDYFERPAAAPKGAASRART